MLRKLIPLALALALTACADIDQGLYNISQQVAPQDRVTGRRSLSFASRQQQIESSNRQTSAMLQQGYLDKGRPVNEQVDPAAYARLQSVFRRVHSVSHLNGEDWQAWLLPDNDWNAFTAGGTYIFVYKGLMDSLKSDDQLAAVIGHEIAHVAANHVYEQQSYTMAARLQGSKSAGRQSFQSAFTLKNEEEADRIGILYAALAGYDPYAAAQLWKDMYDHQGDFSAAVIDHPVNSERYARARQLAQEYSRYYIPGRVNPDAPAILQSALGEGQIAPGAAPGQGGGLAAALETAADVFMKRSAAKSAEADQKAEMRLISAVNQVLSVNGVQAADSHTLRAAMHYGGDAPVSNLNIVAAAGRETANYHIEGLVPPGAEFVAEFRFDKTDVRQVDPRALRFGVTHVEPAR